jgi:hypothetical protein
MVGGAIRRGLVVAAAVVAWASLPAAAAVGADGPGDRGKGACCHQHGGRCARDGREEHGRRHRPDRRDQRLPSAPGRVEAARRPSPRSVAVPAVPAAVTRISRPAPVAPPAVARTTPAPVATPVTDEPVGVGSTLAVGATMAAASPTRVWAALLVPLIAAAVVLALIAVGFATRRNLARVD